MWLYGKFNFLGEEIMQENVRGLENEYSAVTAAKAVKNVFKNFLRVFHDYIISQNLPVGSRLGLPKSCVDDMT